MKKETVRARKARTQRWYDAGWYQDENDVWRCRGCKLMHRVVSCCCEGAEKPGHCENCGSTNGIKSEQKR